MSVVCTSMLLVCTGMYSYVSRMLLVCYAYVPVCYPYVLVCTRTSLVCHPCGVLVKMEVAPPFSLPEVILGIIRFWFDRQRYNGFNSPCGQSPTGLNLF